MNKKNNQSHQAAPQEISLNETFIVRNLSLVSIAGNSVLFAFKLFAGVFGNSGAMISDAIHSLTDVLTTVIALVGVKVSKKGADGDHPYGHERVECVASLLLGAILFATGIGIGRVGILNIVSNSYHTLVLPRGIALAAAIVSILGKEAMYWYTRYYAKLIHSAAFMADAWHHRSDAFSSVGSLIGIAGAMAGFPVMDSVASVAICLFIVKAAVDILKDAIIKMLDTSCGETYEKTLADHVAAQNGVVAVDSIRSRMFGNKVYVDLEISVDGNQSLREAHEIAEHVHKDMEERFSEIKHIMIHVNPAAP